MLPLIEISRELAEGVRTLQFSDPVSHVYHPLVYARQPHEAYLRAFGSSPKRIILLGMNPGPFGMAQTGVPFGDPVMVSHWLGIRLPVEKPEHEHPKRPVLGFESPRREVSGTRLWSWAQSRFETPRRFFQDFFVANYCPLAFLEESGRNRTPDKLPRAERDALFAVCNRALLATVQELRPEVILGVGRFAETRARQALSGMDMEIGTVLHPSPASPKANQGWAQHMDEAMKPWW